MEEQPAVEPPTEEEPDELPRGPNQKLVPVDEPAKK